MNDALKKRFGDVVSEYKGLKYFRTNRGGVYIIFKHIINEEEGIEEDWEDDGRGNPVFCGTPYAVRELDECEIFHRNRFLEGDEKKAFIDKHKKKLYEEPDLLLDDILGSKVMKIYSKEYITPLRKILRDAGVMKDKRGTNKPTDPIVKIRNDFFVEWHKKKGCPKRIPLEEIADAWEDEFYRRFPKGGKEFGKYFITNDAVRKIIKAKKPE